jgi:hypothetical protein
VENGDLILSTKHTLYYDCAGPVPIGELAASLVAFEKVVKQARPLFEMLYSCQISDVRVYVNEIETGSLLDDFVIKFVFKDQAAYDACVANLRKVTGVQKLTERLPTIGPLITVALLAGGISAVSRGCGSDGISVNLKNARDNVIVIAAGEHQMKPEDFQAVVNDALKDRYLLATNAAKVFLPAKKENADSSIKIDDRVDLMISPEAVKEVPVIVKKGTAKQSQEVHSKITIQIRALDLDNRKKGWGVMIPSISNARIPLELDPQVNPAELLGRSIMQADIEVFFRVDAAGDEHIKSAYLRKVYPPAE